MLARFGVLAGDAPPECFEVTSPLLPRFMDNEELGAKKLRDQQRLYAMVQYASEEGDRQEFLNRYFLE
jgi:ATP-dependent DNA helicase RecQ